MKNQIFLELVCLNEYSEDIQLKKIDENDYDKVFIVSNELENIGFKNKITELNRPILKIVYGNKAIYRKFKQGKSYRIKGGQIGLLSRDLNYLNLKTSDFRIKLDIQTVGFLGLFKYYWKNPNQDIRIATRIFIISIFISFFLGIIGSILGTLIFENLHF